MSSVTPFLSEDPSEFKMSCLFYFTEAEMGKNTSDTPVDVFLEWKHKPASFINDMKGELRFEQS